MQFFVRPNTMLMEMTAPDAYEKRESEGFDASMQRAQDLRQFYRETGSQGNLGAHDGGWKHVASIHAPVEAVARLSDPEWLNGRGKRNFYQFLDEHPGYCTYDRRKHAKRGDRVTFVNGKEI